MGFVKVRARVWNVEGVSRVAEIELLADAGAVYMVLPPEPLQSLGVKSTGRRRFRPAGSRVVERDVGIIGMQIANRWSYTLAVFRGGGLYLLGVITPEELGLEVPLLEGFWGVQNPSYPTRHEEVS